MRLASCQRGSAARAGIQQLFDGANRYALNVGGEKITAGEKSLEGVCALASGHRLSKARGDGRRRVGGDGEEEAGVVELLQHHFLFCRGGGRPLNLLIQSWETRKRLPVTNTNCSEFSKNTISTLRFHFFSCLPQYRWLPSAGGSSHGTRTESGAASSRALATTHR